MTEPTALEMHPSQLLLNDNFGRNYLVQLDARGMAMLKATLSVLVLEPTMCKVSRLPSEVSIKPTINMDDI